MTEDQDNPHPLDTSYHMSSNPLRQEHAPESSAYREGERKQLRRDSRVPRAVRRRDGKFCQACNTYCGLGEVHHIQPLSMGGADSIENAILLCGVCHKHAPDNAEEFLAYQRRGGKFAETIANLLKEQYYSEQFGTNSSLRPRFRDALDQLKAAIHHDNHEEIYKFTHRAREQEFGIVKLEPYVRLAINGRMTVDEARKENMKAMQEQITVIEWAQTLYPLLPMTPRLLDEMDWRN